MAEVAGTIGHLDMGPHHDLAMAARAAKLLAPPQVTQVKSVVKSDSLLIGHLPRENVGGMAARAQTAGVFDLGVGFGAVFFGHDLDHVVDGLELGPHRRFGLGRHMTGHAGHLIVLRSLPGLEIGPHDVTTVAKRRAHAVVKQADE
jgi:hypothetical protein